MLEDFQTMFQHASDAPKQVGIVLSDVELEEMTSYATEISNLVKDRKKSGDQSIEKLADSKTLEGMVMGYNMLKNRLEKFLQ